MSDLPARLHIAEEGPREGFQIETGEISTTDKVALINALSATGVEHIQACSFVSPRLVPGWADAAEVVEGFTPREGVSYTALWFNQRGLQRACEHRDKLTVAGSIHLAVSEPFSISNLNRDRQGNLEAVRQYLIDHGDAGVAVEQITLMAAFGCNFAGDIAPEQVVASIQDGLDLATEADTQISGVTLCDTMGWANPVLIERTIGAVRNRYPDLEISLHLHDTRGLGIANAYAGIRLGVAGFDTTVGGLGGCPFAKQPGAPGNIATEELVLLASELGIETGIDLDALIEAGHLAERIVGRSLPSAPLRGGSLGSYRSRVASSP